MMPIRQPYKLLETWFGYFQGKLPLIAVPSQIVSTPSLNLGTSSSGSPGTQQTFTVEGTNLSTDIVVTGSTNVEVSLTSGAGFTSSVSVTPTLGTVTTTTIYARTKSTAPVGAVAETLAVASGGAQGYSVACSGTVSSGPSFPSGALAIWDFEDTLVSSPGAYTLTASGGNSYVAGKVNTKALQLTAGNTASTSDATVNAVWAGACTLSIWVKAATIAGQVFFASDSWGITCDAGHLSLLYDGSGGGGSANGLTALSNDTWYHIVVTSDGGTNPPKVYLNGALEATGDNSLALDGAATSTAVGSNANTSSCVFDQVVVDDRAWTAQEVADVYNGGSGLSS